MIVMGKFISINFLIYFLKKHFLNYNLIKYFKKCFISFMKEFTYLIKKLEESFSNESSFTKTKNKFNKLHDEFINFQLSANETKYLLIPLERIFLSII